MSRLCHIVRVFTRNGVGGNHLGVVLDSSGLRTVDMQKIASGLGFSETVFLEGGDALGVRIFTPGREMPFAGHPLVGMTWVLHDSVLNRDVEVDFYRLALANHLVLARVCDVEEPDGLAELVGDRRDRRVIVLPAR